jgi:hypothetical protein
MPAKTMAMPKELEDLEPPVGLNAIPLRIVHFHFAEQRGLRFKLRAVANNYNLRVGGIKLFLRGIKNIRGSESQNAFTIGFQIVVRQTFQRCRGELPGKPILRCQPQRK